MPEKLLNTKEASEFLGVPEEEIRKLVEKGILPAYKVGGQFLRFRKEQIEAIREEVPRRKRTAAAYPETLLDRILDFFYFNDFYIISAVIILLILWVVLRSFMVFADTVYLNDGGELMGIVVEEYNDRLVMSTHEGEKTLLKKDIRSVAYDLLEQNLVKLGDKHTSRKEYRKAYFYYDKATKVNPEYRPAREKMNYVMGYFFRKKAQEKLEDVKRMGEFENWPGETPAEEDFKSRLEGKIGMRISEEENRIKVRRVLKDSPAGVCGLKEEDEIASVWGQLTGYMSEEEVARLLLEKNIGEIKISIGRDIVVKKKEGLFGGKLDMLMDGLTVVNDIAGLKKGDLIVAINGSQTRYTPLKDAIKIIENDKNDVITFTIRRNVTIWRTRT